MASVRKRQWESQGEQKTAWIVSYTDGSGRRRIKTFDLKKDADRYRSEVDIEVRRGGHIASRASARMDVLMDEFLRMMDVKRTNGRMSQGRIHVVKNAIETYFRPVFGTVLATELTADLINQSAALMAARNKPATIQSNLQILRLICDFAIRRGVLYKNPVSDVLKERGGVERESVRVFSPDDISKLFSALQTRPPGKKSWSWAQLTCWVHIAAFCGLRIGEIAGLTLANVDVESRVIHVRHNLSAFEGLKKPKTRAGVRSVPMPFHVAGLLKQWIERFYIPNDEQLLFLAKGADPIFRPTNFWKMWTDLLSRCGFEKDADGRSYHFHALRHFAASYMIEHGMPIPEVSALIGHSKIDTTLRIYTHPFVQEDRQARIMESMATAIMPPSGTANATKTIEHDGAHAT